MYIRTVGEKSFSLFLVLLFFKQILRRFVSIISLRLLLRVRVTPMFELFGPLLTIRNLNFHLLTEFTALPHSFTRGFDFDTGDELGC